MRYLVFAFWTAVAAARDLPPGNARPIIVRECGACHELTVVTAKGESRARWQAIVEEMAAYGAKLSKDEIEAVVGYLARNFPAQADHVTRRGETAEMASPVATTTTQPTTLYQR